MAAGTAQLWQQKDTRTLLSPEKVEPIAPLAGLVEMGYGITWNNKGCIVKHPAKGDIKVEMKNGCPMVKGGEALQLIEVLENFNLNRRRICKLSQVEETVMAKWKNRWAEVPEAVWEVLGSGLEMVDPAEPFKQDFHKVLPWNRRMRRKVEAAKNVVPHLQRGQEILNPAVKAYLFQLCSVGKISGIVGGPFADTKGRLGRERFGLYGLSAEEQLKVHQDSALWLMPMVLFEVAREARSEKGWMVPAFVQENPRDPKEWLGTGENGKGTKQPEFGWATCWAWPKTEEFAAKNKMLVAKLDQGPLGHERRKPTTLLTNQVEVGDQSRPAAGQPGDAGCGEGEGCKRADEG